MRPTVLSIPVSLYSSVALCIPKPCPLSSDPIKSEEFDQIPLIIIPHPHIQFHSEEYIT